MKELKDAALGVAFIAGAVGLAYLAGAAMTGGAL